MKTVTAKMFVSLVGILLAAPFFAVALVIGARAVALSQDSQDDLLLVALALGGAAISIANGMGRRAAEEKRAGQHVGATSKAALHRASMIHLGH